jgi:Zn-dependent protease
VLFALVHPVAFVALVASFLLGIVVRAVAIRFTAKRLGLADREDSVVPRLREDIDPFGAVAAAIAGMGWGKMLSVDDIPQFRGRGRAATVFLAGPLSCLVLAQVFFVAYVLAYPFGFLAEPSLVLHGVDGAVGQQILLSFAVGLLSFGILELIPIPPLDGFGVLWYAMRRPGKSMQWMRLWFEHKNVGVVILLVISLFPLGSPFLLRILNFIGLLVVNLWARV